MIAKAVQLSLSTVCVGEVPAEVCSHGAADVRMKALFDHFGTVTSVCLHPKADGTAGWATVTFEQPFAAAAAIRVGVSVEVSPQDGREPYTAELQLQKATMAMESRAMAAVQIGGRGAAPVRRRGHSSFMPSSAADDHAQTKRVVSTQAIPTTT